MNNVNRILARDVEIRRGRASRRDQGISSDSTRLSSVIEMGSGIGRAAPEGNVIADENDLHAGNRVDDSESA